MIDIKQEQTLDQELSFEYRENKRKLWNERVSDPFAFTPHELRDKISLERSIEENQKLGRFESEFLKARIAPKRKREVIRRRAQNKRVVAVGYGRGYDFKFLKEVMYAGLKLTCIDVSDVSCRYAEEDLANQLQEISWEGLKPQPRVYQCEICYALADPEMHDIELTKVEFWYLGRTLGCLSAREAAFVLQNIGQSLSRKIDSGKKNRIVLVLAFNDDNVERIACTSQLFSRYMVLANIRRGARRRICVSAWEQTHYYSQVYTALEVKAK